MRYALALTAVLAIAAAAIVATRASTTASDTPYSFHVDCNPALAGIQNSCDYPAGTSTVTVDVVLLNGSDQPTSIAAMNFDTIVQSFLVPLAPPCLAPYWSCNPDFNDALAGAAIWNCAPPPPSHDIDPSPTIARSFISCHSIDTPPSITVNPGQTLVLGSVSYAPTGVG